MESNSGTVVNPNMRTGADGMGSTQLSFNDFSRRESYPAGFWKWLTENRPIYDAFRKKAIQMAMTGRRRYSARTIVENIRWETELADSDKQFKINNNAVPGMARLFMHDCGEMFPDFFRLRDSLGRDL